MPQFIPQSPVDVARQQIDFAHRYTQELLNGVPDADWFRQPTGVMTHIAWQVGHIAMAQYGLTMIRIRGKEPEDERFMPGPFFKAFKKGSDPTTLSADTFPPAAIREVYEAVHAQTMTELVRYTEDELNVPLPEPHAVVATKLGSLFFSPAHEMLHAGQIGLLRRLLGHAPIR